MRKRLLSVLSALTVLLMSVSLFVPAAYADSKDEFTYTIYLNTMRAYRSGDKVIGGVNTVNVIVEYDPSELELISNFSSDKQSIFPKLKGSAVVNNEPGRLGFNALGITPFVFNKDSDILAQLSFRYKKTSHTRVRVTARITELATETTGGYVQLIDHDVSTRDGIRVRTERTPDSASGLLLGDADFDGSVTISDATSVRRRVLWLANGDFVEGAADVDKDGKVTVVDATYIQRYVTRLSSRSGIGKKIV